MKKEVFRIAVGVCVLALMTATAFAQLPGMAIRVNIPFDFSVKGKSLPAGEYEVLRISDDGQELAITNIHHPHTSTMIQTDPVNGTTPRGGELIFHRYGDSYFLYEIWTAGVGTGRELMISHQEKMARREATYASKSAEPQMVAIAIN